MEQLSSNIKAIKGKGSSVLDMSVGAKAKLDVLGSQS